jgi:nitronate monooxygenase
MAARSGSAPSSTPPATRVRAGFITWSLANRPELLDILIDRGADPVFLSFGDPSPFIPRIRDAGRRLILQVTSLAEARSARDLGADAIVAQGTEAGGHGIGGRALFAFLPAAVDAVRPIPVLAAGGVSDGRGLAAALMLGAEGVLVGTRFFASREALGHEGAKRRIMEAGGDDTLRTRVFDAVRGIDWPPPYSGRAIANEFTRTWHGRDHELELSLGMETQRHEAARRSGDFRTAVLFAGEGIDLIHDCPAAADIIQRIVGEAETLLESRPRQVGEEGMIAADVVQTGGCICGSVRFATRSQPLRVTLCHCKWCQRRTGTAFGTEVVFESAQVEFSGEEIARYRHLSEESGRWLDTHFCRRCGVNLGLTLKPSWYPIAASGR